MGWTNLTNAQMQLTRNMPRQGCYSGGYANGKLAFQGTAQLERFFQGASPPASPVQLTGDPTSAGNQALGAQVSVAVAEDLSLGFELNESRGRALANSVRGGNASPSSFGNALLECISIKQKLNLGGQQVTVGVGGDADLCFFSVQFPLAQWRPEFPRFTVGEDAMRVRANLQGTVTVKFGLNQAGWRWLATQVGQRLIPLLRNMGSAVGRNVLRPVAQVVLRLPAFAGTAAGVTLISVVGGVAGGIGLAYLCARFTESARQSGVQWAHCGQYALGYVSAAWSRFDTGQETPDIMEGACGSPRPSHTGDQIRLIGVAHALEDIQRSGGGEQGARVVRRSLLSDLNITGIDPNRAILPPPQPVVSQFRDALRRQRG